MPKDVYDKVKGEIPYEVGVLVSDMKKDYGRITLYHAKNAKRKDRNKPLSEMLLMMFRSAVRDTISKATKIKKIIISNTELENHEYLFEKYILEKKHCILQ